MKASPWPRRCSTTPTDDRDVWIALGQIYTRLRRWKDAEDALNKATP